MIREQLSEVDTMIKDYFQGNGRILVKVLVCQALLIGVLTFLCLIRPGGEDIQAQANLVLDQDAIHNADGNIKATAEVIIIPSKPNSSDKELSYHVLGYFLHFQIQLASGLLTSVFGLLKYLLLGPLFLVQYLVVFLMWLLGCGKEQVLASFPFMQETTQICLENVDDGKRKLMEAVLLLIHSGLLTMLIKKYMARSSRPGGQTILQINSKGDWEYAPSNKREAAIKF